MDWPKRRDVDRTRAERAGASAARLADGRARSWMLALRQGRYTDTVQIARRFGLSDPHVRRLLRLAYIAPEIVEAIAEGRQPRSLTVKLLL